MLRNCKATTQSKALLFERFTQNVTNHIPAVKNQRMYQRVSLLFTSTSPPQLPIVTLLFPFYHHSESVEISSFPAGFPTLWIYGTGGQKGLYLEQFIDGLHLENRMTVRKGILGRGSTPRRRFGPRSEVLTKCLLREKYDKIAETEGAGDMQGIAGPMQLSFGGRCFRFSFFLIPVQGTENFSMMSPAAVFSASHGKLMSFKIIIVGHQPAGGTGPLRGAAEGAEAPSPRPGHQLGDLLFKLRFLRQAAGLQGGEL
jgi:hypothetical protein